MGIGRKILKKKNIQTEETGVFGLRKYREIDLLLKKFPYNSKFVEEIDKTKKESEAILKDYIGMKRKDWEILTILRLFDRATYEHSLGTFIIVKDKIENYSKKEISLKEGIKEEIGDLDVFYRACLFHDIGKITIPKFILRNSLTDKQWALRFYRELKKRKNKVCFTTKKYLKKHGIFNHLDRIVKSESSEEILGILKEKKLRPVQVFPVCYGISKKEFRRLKKEYKIEDDLTLADLMKLHEEESYNILHLLGYEKEALIAGSHGIGGNGNSKFSKSHTSVKIGSQMSDIVDLIYLADVQDALGNDRYYHKSFTKLKILSMLISDMKKGIIDERISYIWVDDEFEKLRKEESFKKMIKKIKQKEEKVLSDKELEIKKDYQVVKEFVNSLCLL